MMDLILVDENDLPVGIMEKMEAHRKGLLHRAFSIFIFNNKNEMLLQQRALDKYHSGGLWTNACCSHPGANSPSTDIAASARLQEEMGFTVPLKKAFHFIYKETFDNGLTEHEYDHVFTGTYEGSIIPDPNEVKDYCFMSMEEIRRSIESHPAKFTAWFKIAFPKLEDYLAAS
jgi:isopentenyl-diphosphate delta-isomerase